MTRQPLPHPSVLPLDGGINFRDLGNKVLPDGSKIKPGLLFRAGALDRLSDNDLTRLTEQNLFQILITATAAKLLINRIVSGMARCTRTHRQIRCQRKWMLTLRNSAMKR